LFTGDEGRILARSACATQSSPFKKCSGLRTGNPKSKIAEEAIMNPPPPQDFPQLRSRDWFGKRDRWGVGHRAWLRSEGFTELVFENKPVIGICNSWSELNNCNAHLRTVAEAVKRGVWAAGGFPLEFNTISLGEMLMKPTTMLYRNLMRWRWRNPFGPILWTAWCCCAGATRQRLPN
jgi:hypothetical protein